MAVDAAEPADHNLRCVWVDSDDEALEVDVSVSHDLQELRADESEATIPTSVYLQRLREYSQRIGAKNVSWVEKALERAVEQGVLPQATSSVALAAKTIALPSGRLRIDLYNGRDHPTPGFQSLSWHPSSQLLAVGRSDCSVHLFLIENDNPDSDIKISIAGKRFPLRRLFFADTERFYAFGRSPNFFSLDLIGTTIQAERVQGIRVPSATGEMSLHSHECSALSPDGLTLVFADKEHGLHTMSTETLAHGGTFQCPTTVNALAFGGAKGDLLIAVGDRATISILRYSAPDLGSTTVLSDVTTVQDPGMRSLLSVAACPGTGLFAVGTEDGVLSLYKIEEANGVSVGKPYIFDNLGSPVTSIDFHPSGEMLAWASNQRSRQKERPLRIAHVASKTVFNNWPTENTRIDRVTDLKFSPDGTKLAIANENGFVGVYLLLHYSE